MTETNWERLGRLLIERRVELGFPNRTRFAEAKGFPNTRVLAAIENAERENFEDTTLTQVEIAYGWSIGSVAVVLDGGEPTLREDAAEATPIGTSESRFDRLAREADEAQAEFERLVGELAAAEARVDATSRNVFAYLAYQNKFAEEVRRREAQLGRKLSRVETLAIDSMDRPTPWEIAELVATHAEIDPHEWTRYEMALIEVFNEGYPRPVEEGSRYADLAPARARAARLLKPEGGSGDGETPAQKSAYVKAAKRGQKEGFDEPQ